MSVPVLDVRGLAYAYPDGHQALFGVDLHVHQGERVALLGPTAPARPRSCCTSTGSSPRAPARSRSAACPWTRATCRDPAPGRHRLPGPRRPALHGHGAPGRRVRAREPRPPRRRARPPRDGGARAGRDGGVRRPPAAPPLLRPAAPGRGRDRAGDGAGDPGARRAVVQPRPRLPPRARRHPPLAGRDGADGHPRPAVRPGAVPAVGGAQRRHRGRRRGDVRRAHRRRADDRAPAGAPVRVRPAAASAPTPLDSLARREQRAVRSGARDRGDQGAPGDHDRPAPLPRAPQDHREP